MELSEIWIGIIIPVVLGPVFIYLKSLRDEIVERRNATNREKYLTELNAVKQLMEEFYWPLYITLLSIQQFNYQIPIKNRYRYESGNSSNNSEEDGINFNTQGVNEIDVNAEYNNSIPQNRSPISMESDGSSDNYEVSINISGDKSSNILTRSSQISNPPISNPITRPRKRILLDKSTLELLKTNLEQKYADAERLIEINITKSCIYNKLNIEMIDFIKYTKIRAIINEGSPNQSYNIEYFGIQNNLEELINTTKHYLDIINQQYIKLINNPV